MLNLRRTFWKENVYSASYRWGSDVPLFTNILALWNPIGSGKILKVLQIDLGASASNNITVTGNITLFTAILGVVLIALAFVFPVAFIRSQFSFFGNSVLAGFPQIVPEVMKTAKILHFLGFQLIKHFLPSNIVFS